MSGRAIFASFDRVPAPKGASAHIEAFARALAPAVGGMDLITLGDEGTGKRSVAPRPLDPPELERLEIGARGGFLDRVLDFRRGLVASWGERRRAFHFRSIFEGYPVARQRDRLVDRLVFEVNALPSVELKYHWADVADDRELHRKLRAQEETCLREADRVVVPSDVTASFVVQRGADPARVRVVRNGVDLERYPWPPRRPEPGPTLRVLYVGTFSSWQGVEVAVDAVARVRRAVPATLRLVGPCRGTQRADIQRRAARAGVESHVTFAPAVASEDLPRLYAEHDVALAPLVATERNLDQGCCPLKVLEAMAAGIPLVASDLPVVRELVSEREAWLVPPGRAQALADALIQVATTLATAVRKAAAARERVEAGGGWASSCHSLLEIYSELGILR